MRSGGRGAQYLEAPQYPFFILVLSRFVPKETLIDSLFEISIFLGHS